MDAPHIQYARTSDGVSIAYGTTGAGPAVIMPPSVVSFASTHPPFAESLCEAVARRFTLVQYDGRGMGLSERDRDEHDLAARLHDLEAVIESVGADSVALMGRVYGGLVAIAYARRKPERVRRLVLINSLSSGERFFTETPVGRFNAALGPVIEEQWEQVSEAIAAQLVRRHPDASPSGVRGLGAGYRESWTPAGFLAHRQALRAIDVTAEASAITVPTLVLSTASEGDTFGLSRDLARTIPNARLLRVSERWTGWEQRDYAALIAFLEEPGGRPDTKAPAARTDGSGVLSGTAIILFLDIVDSTALTTQLGDAAYREKERELDGALRDAIRDAGGVAVDGKVLGDGVMATFTSAKDAIDVALRCQELGEEAGLPLHAGIHAGDVTREGNNVHGGAVQVAARIADASTPGEVLVSDIVRGLARTSAGVSFEDRGERELKGVGEPVRVFAVRGE